MFQNRLLNPNPLKTDFHIHTAEDPLDRVHYTAQELILKAADEGFEVGYHQSTLPDLQPGPFFFGPGHEHLPIPGIETTIQNRHVLILNPPGNRTYPSFSSLAALNRPDCLVIAPHPYFPGLHSLNGYQQANLKLFHALEYSHFYSSHLNFNQRVLELARSSGLPLLGNS